MEDKMRFEQANKILERALENISSNNLFVNKPEPDLLNDCQRAVHMDLSSLTHRLNGGSPLKSAGSLP
jgi:hypothetical protein